MAKPRSAKMKGGIWGIISGVVGMAASKEIIDYVHPGDPNNIIYSGLIGLATGLSVGILTGSGVIGLNIYKGMFVTERSPEEAKKQRWLRT